MRAVSPLRVCALASDTGSNKRAHSKAPASIATIKGVAKSTARRESAGAPCSIKVPKPALSPILTAVKRAAPKSSLISSLFVWTMTFSRFFRYAAANAHGQFLRPPRRLTASEPASGWRRGAHALALRHGRFPRPQSRGLSNFHGLQMGRKARERPISLFLRFRNPEKDALRDSRGGPKSRRVNVRALIMMRRHAQYLIGDRAHKAIRIGWLLGFVFRRRVLPNKGHEQINRLFTAGTPRGHPSYFSGSARPLRAAQPWSQSVNGLDSPVERRMLCGDVDQLLRGRTVDCEPV